MSGGTAHESAERGRTLFAVTGAWLQAARIHAFPMILIPLLLGQAQAYRAEWLWQWRYFVLAALFGLIYQVYLLYTNDHADEAIDRTNGQYWLSGGSRVLPDGKLDGAALLIGANIALLALIAVTAYLVVIEQRIWMLVATPAAVFLCWAYNRPPLRWSYSGHGEVLQGLGCGVLLPLIGYYLHAGTLAGYPWVMLIPSYLVFHAGNIVTALPDYASDFAGGKSTLPVRYGERMGRWVVLSLLAMAYLSFVLLEPMRWVSEMIIVGVPLLILGFVIVSGLVERANVSEFAACKVFVNWISASQAWFLCAWVGWLFVASRS